MGRTLLVSGALVTLLLGCGEDPVLKAAHEQAASQSATTQAQPGVEPGDDPAPGRPDEPPPGIPDEPPPGGGGGGGDIVPSGETVTLSGEVEVPGYTQGVVVIDVFDGDHSKTDGARPSVVGRKTLEAPGSFSIQVPKGQEAWLSAYVDVDGNGRPDGAEPVGNAAGNPFSGAGDQVGVGLVLEPADQE